VRRFFDVKKYPVITFTSEGGKIKKDKFVKMKGNLTIRDDVRFEIKAQIPV